MSESERIGSGFTEGELQFASFWVRNRVKVHRWIIGILTGINVLFWGYAIWGVVDAYVISYPIESRIMQDLAENQFLSQEFESNRPRSIATDSPSVFEGTDGRLDCIVPIKNPNEQWYAEFTYRFTISGEETPLRSGFILPKSSSVIGEYGFLPKTKGGKNAVLHVESLHWKRVDPQRVGSSYDEWSNDRLEFALKDVSYRSDVSVGTKKVSRTHVLFENNSAFGYWTIGLHVVLMRGSAPVAANYVDLTNVKPGESRNVDVDWYDKVPSVTETQIFPVVNIFDDSAYLPSSRF